MITMETVDIGNMKIWYPPLINFIFQACEIPKSGQFLLEGGTLPGTIPATIFYEKQPLSPLLCISAFFTLLLRVVDLSERESEEEEKAGKMISDNPEGNSGFLRKDSNSVENCWRRECGPSRHMQIICKSHMALLFYNLDVPLGKMPMETSGLWQASLGDLQESGPD